jgi:sec-independent protein translocase protein TatC
MTKLLKVVEPHQEVDPDTLALNVLTNIPPNDAPQPLINHLIELRRRLIYCAVVFFALFSIAYTFSGEIFEFLVRPLAVLLKGQDRRLIYTGLTEAFLTYIKVAIFTAFCGSFPLIAFQVWAFISPGLFKAEKHVILPFLLATPLLFFLGGAFAYFYVFPNAYAFFLSFESIATDTMLAVQLEAKVNEYLSFVMRLILAFGICFEMPVLFGLLGRSGFVSSKGLLAKWRIAVVAITALSAIITPPDIFSMIALALPLIALYGISIVMVRWLEQK